MLKHDLNQIYLDYSDNIYRFIYFYVRHKEVAEDLTQETFYRVYKNLHTYKHNANMEHGLRGLLETLHMITSEGRK